MKFLSIFFFFAAGCASQTGQFVDRGLFNNSPFVTAKGASADEAKARALAAVPSDFEVDREFISPVLSCANAGEAAVFDSKTLENTRCPSGHYRVDIALLPKAGEERDAILRTRADGIAALERGNREEPAQVEGQ